MNYFLSIRFFFGFLLLFGAQNQVLAFTDVTIDQDFYLASTYLENQKIFKGYPDGSFGKDKLINRVEALKTILVAANEDVPTSKPSSILFTDVPLDSWFAPFVSYALGKNIVSGDGNTTNFSPARNVNKAEFLKMMMESFNVDTASHDLSEISINDVQDSDWFAPYLKFAVKYKILTPDGENNIQPGKQITREEAAEILFATLKIGKGLDPQTLLTVTEYHLIQSFEFLEAGNTALAPITISIAEQYVQLAMQTLPEHEVVQSANKIVIALKSMINAYLEAQNGNYDAVITYSKTAWNNADEGFKINPNNKDLSEKIKNIASTIAASARAKKGE